MECFFIHNEWNDICILDNNIIYRKNILNERGYYYFENDYFIIKWDNWPGKNYFLQKDNIYIYKDLDLENIIIKKIHSINNEREYIFLNNDEVIKKNEHNNRGKYIIKKNILEIKWGKNQEFLINKNNNYYELDYIFQQDKKNTNESMKKMSSFNKLNIINDDDDNDDIENEIELLKLNKKNIFCLVDGFFYSKSYLEKNNLDNQYFSFHNLHTSYNKDEHFFKNLHKYNNNYLDIDNFNQHKQYFIIDEKKIMNKFFKLNIKYKLNISTTRKRIITISEWGYPAFGGGENWLLNLSKIFYNLNYDPYLLCFSNGFTGNSFQTYNLIDLKYVKIIQMPFDIIEICKLIKIINPILINHQGIKRIEIMQVANCCQKPFITGFCFWNNIIKQLHSNVNILENNHLEKDESFYTIEKYSYTYCASEFVNDVIQKFFKKKINVIETISLKEDYFVENIESKYVTLLNCHYNKGGYLINYLLKNLDINIPIMLIYTEYDDKLSLSEIKELMKERNIKNNINILYEEKQKVINIYSKTKIMLIPSLCDETFCRVAYESMMNNIPIISNNSGNLKYLLDNYAIILDKDEKKWKIEIEKIYFKNSSNNNTNTNKNKFKLLINKYESNIESKVKNMINEASISKYNYNEKNIGIIAPWADQGLGIQSRSYYHTLKNIGFSPHIFSFKPYHASEQNNYLQVDKNEWLFDNIYYSPNIREKIDFLEMLQFIHKYNIKKIIIIEATFEHIFRIVSLLKLIHVECYIIVNIECIKISEINYHIMFDKILCNNFNSYFIMNNLIENKCKYLGFHLEHPFFYEFEKELKKNNTLNFVCSGGLNSISRKNIDVIYDIFDEIIKKDNNININLKILIQGIEIPEQLKNKNKIIIHIENCSYLNNLKNISSNDIYIHCGGQEGLGLGFYESLYLGLPIITLDWTPNNEIIKNNYNGWLIDCYYDKVFENTECLINRGLIKKDILKNKIIEIINTQENTIDIINNTINNRKYLIQKNKNNFEKNMHKILSSPVPSFY